MEKEITAGICTSGSKVKAALCADGKFSVLSKRALNQEKILLPMIERLLKKHKAGLKDLSAICVITGPGRFTGLRIALTLASTLKTWTGMKVYSSTLFEILASQALASRGFRAWASGKAGPLVAALMHAFKDEYFCQVFHVLPGGRFKAAEPPRWLKDAEVGAYLKAFGTELYVAADAEEKPDIYSLVPSGFAMASASVSRIDPSFIIRTGLALKNKDLKPLYLKPAKYAMENGPASGKAGKFSKRGRGR